MNHRYLPSFHGFAAAFLLLTLSGCNTSEYEQRMEVGLKKAEVDTLFNDLYAPQVLPDTPVNIRLPKFFVSSPLVEGATADGKPIDIRRIKINTFELPGIKLTYEAWFDDGHGGRVPCYCYVGSVPAKDEDLCKTIVTAMTGKAAYAQALTWTEITSLTPDGPGPKYNWFKATWPQYFFVQKDGQEQFVEMPGIFEIFVREESGHYIIIAWRFPDLLELIVNLSKRGPAVAGCASVLCDPSAQPQ